MVLLTVLNKRRKLIVRKQNPVRRDKIQMHCKPMKGSLRDLQKQGTQHDVSRLKVKPEVCSGSRKWNTGQLLSALVSTTLHNFSQLSLSLAVSPYLFFVLPSFPSPSLRWLALFLHDLMWSPLTCSFK